MGLRLGKATPPDSIRGGGGNNGMGNNMGC